MLQDLGIKLLIRKRTPHIPTEVKEIIVQHLHELPSTDEWEDKKRLSAICLVWNDVHPIVRYLRLRHAHLRTKSSVQRLLTILNTHPEYAVIPETTTIGPRWKTETLAFYNSENPGRLLRLFVSLQHLRIFYLSFANIPEDRKWGLLNALKSLSAHVRTVDLIDMTGSATDIQDVIWGGASQIESLGLICTSLYQDEDPVASTLPENPRLREITVDIGIAYELRAHGSRLLVGPFLVDIAPKLTRIEHIEFRASAYGASLTIVQTLVNAYSSTLKRLSLVDHAG